MFENPVISSTSKACSGSKASLSIMQFHFPSNIVPATSGVWAPCNFTFFQAFKTLNVGYNLFKILEIYQLFEYHAILLPYSAAALFRCLRTLQLHTFPNRKSIGTSKKSGLNPCNFTSAKPTVQHSENFLKFENPVISFSSKTWSVSRPVWVPCNLAFF